MNSALVRKLKKDDLDAVVELETVCFSVPWSRRSFEAELRNACARYIVIEEAGHIIAYAGMWLIIDEGHVTNVAVLPDVRRKGYAKLLMHTLMKTAMDEGANLMTLEVRKSNSAARALYAALGFVVCGVRKGYYSDDREDAIIMWNKDIKSTLQSQ